MSRTTTGTADGNGWFTSCVDLNTDRIPECETTELYISTVAFSIENERGAWRERPRFWVNDWPPLGGIILDGAGEYAGLAAVLFHEGPHQDFWGAIIDARLLPPPPSNASTR